MHKLIVCLLLYSLLMDRGPILIAIMLFAEIYGFDEQSSISYTARINAYIDCVPPFLEGERLIGEGCSCFVA